MFASPLLNLDHIYFDHQLKIQRASFHRNRLSLIASDHLPLVADFTIEDCGQEPVSNAIDVGSLSIVERSERLR